MQSARRSSCQASCTRSSASAQLASPVPYRAFPTDFWVPLMMVDRFEFAGVQASDDNDPGATRLERRGTRWLFLKGRLADGRRIEDARAQIETIFARLRTAYPVTNDKATVSVLPASNIRFHPMLDGYVRAASAALLVAVSLVLLIACANVANMLLARGASRRRELAIRTAIGASRARIVRQLLSEGLVLAAAGGVLGLIIAWWAGRALAAFGTGMLPIPVSFNVSLDATVLMFAVGASIATAILFGVAPAWSASKLELVPALKASMEGDSRRRVTLSNVLVVGQLALSLVLLVAGALLARGLLTARAADLGYDPRHVSLLSFNLQMNGYDLGRATDLRERALRALRALPGVSGRFDRLTGCRCRPKSIWTASSCRAITDLETTGHSSTRRRSARTISASSGCRSSPAAPSPRTISGRSGRSRSSTRRWRGSTGRMALRLEDGSTAAPSNRRHSRSSASRGITRSDRSARIRGPICTCLRTPDSRSI